MPQRFRVRHAVGLPGGHGHVRQHAGAFPVAPGDRVDRARVRHRDRQRGRHRDRPGRVGAAAGRLADQLRAPVRLQGVAEVLAPGERPVAGEHVHRAVEVTLAGHPGQRPELPGLPGARVENVAQVRAAGREQVTAPEHHPLGGPAAVPAQVDDQRVRAGNEFHGGGDGRAAAVRVGHPAHVQVPDVAVQPLHPGDAIVARVSMAPFPGRIPVPARLRPAGAIRTGRLPRRRPR